MGKDQIQKAMELARKTGDKIIVFDSSGANEPFVIMPLDEYEKNMSNKEEVKDLTEDELLDKINRDIAEWKCEQGVSDLAMFSEKDQSLEDEYLLNVSKDSTREADFKDSIKASTDNRSSWSIPRQRKSVVEEVIEEDRQYLEEVDF